MAKAKKTTVKKKTAKNGVKAKPARKPRKGQNLHPRKLTGKLLSDLQKCSYKMELKRAKLEGVQAKLDAMSMDKKYATVFLALRQRDSLRVEQREAILEFGVFQKKLAAKYGIPIGDLHHYTFDTETGGVTFSGAPA